MRAIDALRAEGFAATMPGKNGRDVYHMLKPFPHHFPLPASPDGGSGESIREAINEQFPGIDEGIDAVAQTTSACLGKDGQVRPTTTGEKNGADPVGQHLAAMREAGELPLRIEPKCRACRPELRKRVNELITAGYGLTAILDLVEPINSTLPAKARVTIDSLHKHRKLHYNAQAPAAAIHRRTLEEKAQQAAYDEHVTSLVSAAGVWQVVMDKGFQTLVAEDTQISVEQLMMAARELSRLAAAGDEQQRWAEVHRKQQLIIATFREVVPPQYHEAIMNRLDDKTSVTGRQVAVIEGGQATTDTEYVDPFDDDGEDYDDEDDD